MQQVILEGNNDNLPENAIGVTQIDKNDIVVIQSLSNEIGLLVMDPRGKWFVTDLFNGYNHYPHSYHDSIEECLNTFRLHFKILKFDSGSEFIEWLQIWRDMA